MIAQVSPPGIRVATLVKLTGLTEVPEVKGAMGKRAGGSNLESGGAARAGVTASRAVSTRAAMFGRARFTPHLDHQARAFATRALRRTLDRQEIQGVADGDEQVDSRGNVMPGRPVNRL